MKKALLIITILLLTGCSETPRNYLLESCQASYISECKQVCSKYMGRTLLEKDLFTYTETRTYRNICTDEVYTKEGEQPRLWPIFAGAFSLVLLLTWLSCRNGGCDRYSSLHPDIWIADVQDIINKAEIDEKTHKDIPRG